MVFVKIFVWRDLGISVFVLIGEWVINVSIGMVSRKKFFLLICVCWYKVIFNILDFFLLSVVVFDYFIIYNYVCGGGGGNRYVGEGRVGVFVKVLLKIKNNYFKKIYYKI